MRAISLAKHAAGIAKFAAEWAADAAMLAEVDASDQDAPDDAVARFCRDMRTRIDWIEAAQKMAPLPAPDKEPNP